MKKAFILICFSIAQHLGAQVLKPGFQKQEFIDLLKLSMYQMDTPWVDMEIDLPKGFELAYRSPMMGLENRFDVWINSNKKVAAINVRGSNGTRPSWVENFYSAMIPAKGSLTLNDSTTIPYQLAQNEKAAVHTGWTLGMTSITPLVRKQILENYRNGIHDFYVAGHSQGGAVATLLSAHILQLKQSGYLPQDIRIKTYCSAAPKPGNLFFAMEYEQATQAGWHYNVVNPKDWVPQTPFAVQTIDDFPTTNPFSDAEKSIKNLKFPVDLVVKHVFNQLNKPTQKARKNFEKNLGKRAASIIIKKDLPQYQEPEYFESVNYTRCGQQIILIADEEYLSQFPDTKEDLFTHHRPQAYLYLIEKLDM